MYKFLLRRFTYVARKLQNKFNRMEIENVDYLKLLIYLFVCYWNVFWTNHRCTLLLHWRHLFPNKKSRLFFIVYYSQFFSLKQLFDFLIIFLLRPWDEFSLLIWIKFTWQNTVSLRIRKFLRKEFVKH